VLIQEEKAPVCLPSFKKYEKRSFIAKKVSPCLDFSNK